MTGHPLLWLENAPAERVEAVRADVADFLRAGGRLSLEDWSRMTPLGRRIAAEAGDEVEAARIERLLASVAGALREARVARIVREGAEAGMAECAAGGVS